MKYEAISKLCFYDHSKKASPFIGKSSLKVRKLEILFARTKTIKSRSRIIGHSFHAIVVRTVKAELPAFFQSNESFSKTHS